MANEDHHKKQIDKILSTIEESEKTLAERYWIGGIDLINMRESDYATRKAIFKKVYPNQRINNG